MLIARLYEKLEQIFPSKQVEYLRPNSLKHVSQILPDSTIEQTYHLGSSLPLEEAFHNNSWS